LLIVRPAILDGDVFAFDESSVIQALPKGIDNYAKPVAGVLLRNPTTGIGC
jgi:hypothetical protein